MNCRWKRATCVEATLLQSHLRCLEHGMQHAMPCPTHIIHIYTYICTEGGTPILSQPPSSCHCNLSYVYQRGISILFHHFKDPRPISGQSSVSRKEDVSLVCWKNVERSYVGGRLMLVIDTTRPIAAVTEGSFTLISESYLYIFGSPHKRENPE